MIPPPSAYHINFGRQEDVSLTKKVPKMERRNSVSEAKYGPENGFPVAKRLQPRPGCVMSFQMITHSKRNLRIKKMAQLVRAKHDLASWISTQRMSLPGTTGNRFEDTAPGICPLLLLPSCDGWYQLDVLVDLLLSNIKF